jgi:hypothetical protein
MPTFARPAHLSRLLSGAALFAGTVLIAGVGTVSASTSYRFTAITDPADTTFNQALGINERGVIAGYYGSGADAQHPNQGFTVKSPYGPTKFKSENFPGSAQTQVIAINEQGNTAGFWVDADGNNLGFIDWKGVFASVVDPLTAGSPRVNQLLGLNEDGIAVGFYNDAAGNSHAYKYNRETHKFTPITVPGATSTVATGINDEGDVTGFATVNGTVGFLRDGRKLTEFQVPGASSTQPFGMNNHDTVVGAYTDNAGTHGFVVNTQTSHLSFQAPVDHPNGAGVTFLNGINDEGQIVGFYMPSATSSFGFLAQR